MLLLARYASQSELVVLVLCVRVCECLKRGDKDVIDQGCALRSSAYQVKQVEVLSEERNLPSVSADVCAFPVNAQREQGCMLTDYQSAKRNM